MGYASRSGRAIASARNPRAFAVCDRCGIWTNHYKLSWQYDYAGTGLLNQRILVCRPCLDIPQPQLQAKRCGPDPLPILNARPEPFTSDETTYLTTESGVVITDESGNPLAIE